MSNDLHAPAPGDLAARRAIRFENVCAAYSNQSCNGRLGPDRTVPGAARGVAQYAVICETGRAFTANFCASREDVAALAAHELKDGSAPVCYFDLDHLAGDAPLLDEGDVVEVDGDRLYVNHVDEQLIEGEVARYVCLARDPDADWDDWLHRIHEDEFSGKVLERAQPDERLPIRFDVADIVVQVVFNTIATA